MPIRPLLEGELAAFGPGDIHVLIAAFQDSLRELRLVDSSDPAVTMVARRIIDFARRGERDPTRLREAVLNSLRTDAMQPP
jgi:hypothetical protein